MSWLPVQWEMRIAPHFLTQPNQNVIFFVTEVCTAGDEIPVQGCFRDPAWEAEQVSSLREILTKAKEKNQLVKGVPAKGKSPLQYFQVVVGVPQGQFQYSWNDCTLEARINKKKVVECSIFRVIMMAAPRSRPIPVERPEELTHAQYELLSPDQKDTYRQRMQQYRKSPEFEKERARRQGISPFNLTQANRSRWSPQLFEQWFKRWYRDVSVDVPPTLHRILGRRLEVLSQTKGTVRYLCLWDKAKLEELKPDHARFFTCWLDREALLGEGWPSYQEQIDEFENFLDRTVDRLSHEATFHVTFSHLYCFHHPTQCDGDQQIDPRDLAKFRELLQQRMTRDIFNRMQLTDSPQRSQSSCLPRRPWDTHLESLVDYCKMEIMSKLPCCTIRVNSFVCTENKLSDYECICRLTNCQALFTEEANRTFEKHQEEQKKYSSPPNLPSLTLFKENFIIDSGYTRWKRGFLPVKNLPVPPVSSLPLYEKPSLGTFDVREPAKRQKVRLEAVVM